MPDYDRLEQQADTGLGADEYRGPRRFTRPSEKKRAPVHSAKNATEGSDHNPNKELDHERL